jgi:ClpP class serine protease
MKTDFIISAIEAQQWAIQPEALTHMLEIVERRGSEDSVFTALERRTTQPLADTSRTTISDGIARIPVQGSIFPKANIFTEVCGATSCEMLAMDLQAAIDDPVVKGICLVIDSPGGAVSGVAEFAAQVLEARAIKPIAAYVENLCASAAYWIAAQCSTIVASPTAMIGSIGVVAVHRAGGTGDGRSFQFVSNQSPLKRAPVDSEAGALQAQRIVDDLASVFIAAVANGRQTDQQIVTDHYGQGAVFVGGDALNRGMVDSLGSLSDALKEVRGKAMIDWGKITVKDLEANRADLCLEMVAHGSAQERSRIAEIQGLVPKGMEVDASVMARCIDGGLSVGDAAREILANVRPIPTETGAQENLGAKYMKNLVAREDKTEITGTSAPRFGSSVTQMAEEARKVGAIR